MDDWPSPSAPPDPFDPLAVDLWLVQQEEAFAELIARRLTRIVRDAYGAFLDSLPPEEVITAAGDLYELESIVPRWRVVVRTDLVPRLERMYLTGSIAAFTVASMDGDEPRQEIPPGEIEGWARVVNEQAVAYAQTATNRLVGVGDTVFDLIKNRTAKAIERGATNEELKRQVETLAGFSEFRADVVARTEVGMAYGTGDYEGMTALGEYGPVEKEWLAAIDARTRETHVAANGQRVPMNEPFQVGGAQMMYAKQPGAPAREVIQCRCTTLYHFAGDVRPDGSIVGGEALPVAAPAPVKLPEPEEPTPDTTEYGPGALGRRRFADSVEIPQASRGAAAERARALRTVVEEIDKVHGLPEDDVAATVVRLGGATRNKGGHFAPSTRGPKPRRLKGESIDAFIARRREWLLTESKPEILMNSRDEIGGQMTTFAHELGHRVDWSGGGFRTNSMWMSQQARALQAKYKGDWLQHLDEITDPEMRATLELGRLAREFESLKQYTKSAPFAYRQYFYDIKEIWARAYAQWITEVSQNAEMVADMAARIADNSQFTPEEFALMRPHIEAILRARGLMK